MVDMRYVNIDGPPALLLIEIGERNNKLFCDLDGVRYARNNHTGCVSKVESNDFKDFLCEEYFELIDKEPKPKDLKEAIANLSRIAKISARVQDVHLRVAKHENSYYLDLCDGYYNAIVINDTGWRLELKANLPVNFIKTKGMRALPSPTPGTGDVDRLWKYANVPLKMRRLTLACLLECFRSDTPYVVLAFTGGQGSAKSTTQSCFRELVDPNVANNRTAPKSIDDLFVSAVHSHLASYENLSSLSDPLQDGLCTMVTGGGYGKRELFTTSDEVILNIKRPVFLNSIPMVITRPDLMDRAVVVNCPRIERYNDERQLKAEWAGDKAVIFTGLLDLLVGSLAKLSNVDETLQFPRMADFARLGTALGLACGENMNAFLDEYLDHRKTIVRDFLLRDNPIADAMLKYLNANQTGFEGTLQELLNSLDSFKHSETDWPRSARGLSECIDRLESALLQLGVHVSKSPVRRSDGYHCSLKMLNPVEPEVASEDGS